MRRKSLCLALALIVCLAFGACGTPGQKETKETTVQATEAPAKEKVFKTSDEEFQITADEDWKKAKDSFKIDDADLAISKESEGNIVLISESKYNFSDSKLSDYNDLVVRHMQKSLAKDESQTFGEVELGDYTAYKTVITGEADDKATYTYSIYCAKLEDNYIQLICWSKEDEQKDFAAEFDKIAKTLSEVSETEE